MATRFFCLACGTQLEVDDALVGSRVRCGHCGEETRPRRAVDDARFSNGTIADWFVAHRRPQPATDKPESERLTFGDNAVQPAAQSSTNKSAPTQPAATSGAEPPERAASANEEELWTLADDDEPAGPKGPADEWGKSAGRASAARHCNSRGAADRPAGSGKRGPAGDTGRKSRRTNPERDDHCRRCARRGDQAPGAIHRQGSAANRCRHKTGDPITNHTIFTVKQVAADRQAGSRSDRQSGWRSDRQSGSRSERTRQLEPATRSPAPPIDELPESTLPDPGDLALWSESQVGAPRCDRCLTLLEKNSSICPNCGRDSAIPEPTLQELPADMARPIIRKGRKSGQRGSGPVPLGLNAAMRRAVASAGRGRGAIAGDAGR